MTKGMSSLGALVVPLVLVLAFVCSGSSFAEATDADACPPRRCGGHNVRHPFRLQDSPVHCGDLRYQLSCEEDDRQLVLYLKSRKFKVQSIDYNNYTIRLVDANISALLTHDHDDDYHYSSLSLPPYSLASYNFSYDEPYRTWLQREQPLSSGYEVLENQILLYLRCPNAVESSDLYIDAATCLDNGSYAPGSTLYINYDGKSLPDYGLRDSCRIEWMYFTSWPLQNGSETIVSCIDLRNMLLHGFELFWATSYCRDLSSCVVLDDRNNSLYCSYSPGFDIAILLADIRDWAAEFLAPIIIWSVAGRFVLFGVPFIIILSVYKWRRRHLSHFDTIEDFLQSDRNNIMPIRYSYKDIKNITKGFKTKLGNGGYGSVFRGKLRSGRLVAVKVLNKAKSNGQDFINEVATIGRIHHVNVVQLIGFCVEGSKRALIYELMENGSLEKYIFSHEQSPSSLSCEKLYAISLGVARGIEYLHNGCDMKILHFDIKPHNILLDDNFNPKVSDFGLARLCPTDKSIVSLTAARGTIGYMAPELFYRNVGTISYKADVYSFGMLLMEMASRRKNLNALAEHSSQLYSPFWVYERLLDGREIAIENDNDEEMKLAKKMMIVALWCIQTRPSDRPSMDKVVEMLRGQDDEGLLMQIPPKPYFYTQDHLPTRDAVGDSSSSRLPSGVSVSDSNEGSQSDIVLAQ